MLSIKERTIKCCPSPSLLTFRGCPFGTAPFLNIIGTCLIIPGLLVTQRLYRFKIGGAFSGVQAEEKTYCGGK